MTAVLFFGEILPHSLFLKHRFEIGAKMVPVIIFLMLLWWPLAKPLSFILDKFIGADNHLNEDYNRHQVRAMVNYQGRPSQLSPRPFSDRMGGAEVAIIASTLEMKNLRVRAPPLSLPPPFTPLARHLHTPQCPSHAFLHQQASDVMTVLDKADMLPLDSIVSTELLLRIAEEGHSRLPIYQVTRRRWCTPHQGSRSRSRFSQLSITPSLRCSTSSA